ncbi:MAG: cytochrome c [Sphingobacteriia bacterium]|nr:cytochrome c [Sphingobacteriia bacterium]
MKKIIAAFVLVSSTSLLAQTGSLNESVKRGKIVYNKVCLSCHMADGGGVPHLNPPLIKTSYVLGDKKMLIGIVLNGMTDRVPIEDEYYSNNMAPHNDLSNQQIADVLTFIRNNFGNKASAVTVAEVNAVRNKKK